MNQAIGAIVSLIVTLIAVRLLVKKVQPQIVLFAAGLVLLLTAVLLGATPAVILGGAKVKSSGWIYLDIFKVVENTLSTRVAGLGLIIMASGGFAKYMDVIGASTVMVNTVTKPLLRLKAPYLLLALSYMLGTSLKMFITSAAGLSMLLMVTIYPVVVGLGASRVAAAAMVVSCGGLSLGPGAGTTNLAADYAGMDVIKYFLEYQLPVTVAVVLTMGVMHYFVQRYLDKRDGIGAAAGADAKDEDYEKVEARDVSNIPKYYMFLPVIPLVLLLVCSDIGIKGLKMSVVSAMIIGLTISLICECIHKGVEAKAACKEAMSFFDAMGRQFARVITMVVAGEVFAKGLMATGTIDLLINSAKGAGFGVVTMVLVTSGFILLSTIVMGSANAPFYSFSALAPSVAKELSFHPVAMLLPMQFAASLGRIICPITAVVVAVAGVSNISPFLLVRRTVVPAMTALLVALVTSVALTM